MPSSPYCSRELQLLDAIHADPLNDAPRLAYADWLTDIGQAELAEFIRLQCTQPYFALQVAGTPGPNVTLDDFLVQYNDEARAARTIELLRRLHGNDRFPDVRRMVWQEYDRGLPLYEVDASDDMVTWPVDAFCGQCSPLARYRLIITTSRLAEWLAHPLMQLVDVLRICPDIFDENGFAELRREDIVLLEAYARLDDFREVALEGTASRAVYQLVRERLEPRIPIDSGSLSLRREIDS